MTDTLGNKNFCLATDNREENIAIIARNYSLVHDLECILNVVYHQGRKIVGPAKNYIVI